MHKSMVVPHFSIFDCICTPALAQFFFRKEKKINLKFLKLIKSWDFHATRMTKCNIWTIRESSIRRDFNRLRVSTLRKLPPGEQFYLRTRPHAAVSQNWENGRAAEQRRSAARPERFLSNWNTVLYHALNHQDVLINYRNHFHTLAEYSRRGKEMSGGFE